VRSARTGSRWLSASWNSLRDRATPGERANALVAATVERQLTGRPVAEWERARLDETNAARRHNYLPVEQYMNPDLFTAPADDPTEMVATLMLGERIRHMPVETKDHHLVGLVSHRAVLRFQTGGGVAHDTPVSEIMKTELMTVEPETPTLEAIKLMRRY